MKRKVLIIITLLIIIIMPLVSLPINIYSDEAVRNEGECIAAEFDSHDLFYLNPSHQTDFVFIIDNSISLFSPEDMPFKDDFIPHKTASFVKLPYKPPLPRA